MDRRVTSPTWGSPPPCKQALSDLNGLLMGPIYYLHFSDQVDDFSFRVRKFFSC